MKKKIKRPWVEKKRTITIRMPEDVWQRLNKSSIDKKASINKTIVTILDLALN